MSDLPPEREVKEFRFQQLCRFKVTDEPVTSNDRLQLLTNSSKYALTFVAVKEGLKVIDTQELIKLTKQHATDKSVSTIPNVPLRTIIPFTDQISHLAISCDDLTLAVACSSNGNIILYMYDIRGFAVVNNKPNPFKTVRLNTSPGSTLCDISWNPEISNIIITCTTDGGVELLEVNDNVQVSTLPVSTNATCFCWSPKGKQFVVGRRDGTLTQYDRTLVAKKNWPCPPILEGGPYQVVDIVWLSTYMFLVAFLPQSPDPSDQPQVVMITSSKEGNTTYANFEDICFGSGEVRKAKYYMSLIMKWEMAVISSSNATETTIVAKNQTDKVTWEHWILEDSGRAELPLTDSKEDSFPVGFTISYTSTCPDPNSVEAAPILLLFSTDGLLVPFYMVYSHPDTVIVTSPPQPLTSQGERLGKDPSPPPQVTSTQPLPGGSFQFVQKPAVTNSGQFTTPVKGTAGKTTGLFNPSTSESTARSLFGNTGTPSSGFSFSPATATANPTFGTTPASSTPFSFTTGTPTVTTTSKLPSLGASSTSSFSSTPTSGLGTSGGINIGKPSMFSTPVTTLSKQPDPSKPSQITKPTISSGIGVFSGAPASITSAGVGISKPTATVGALSSVSTDGGSTKPTPSISQPQIKALSKVDNDTSKSVDSLIHEKSESTFTDSIIEEMAHFEKELRELKSRTGACKSEIGTKSEMQKIKQRTDEFSKFCYDIKDITKEQSREVSEQKALCLDCFAMAEDCNVRKNRNNDQKYHKLLRSRALDPASADTLKKLQQQYQAIKQGIQDVDLILDTQWDSYHNKNDKRSRLQRPTSDTIYRAVKSNHNLISNQKNKMDEIQEMLKHLQLYKSPLKQTFSQSIQSSLDRGDIFEKSSSKSLVKSSQGGVTVSPEKQAKLRNMLMNRTVPRIKSTVPANLSMSKIVGSPSFMSTTKSTDSSLDTTKESVPSPIAEPKPIAESKPIAKPKPITEPNSIAETKPISEPKSNQLKFSTNLPTSSFAGQAFFKRPHPSNQTVTVPVVPTNGTTDTRPQVAAQFKMNTGIKGSLASGKPISPSAGKDTISQISPVELASYISNARQQGLLQSQYEDITPPSSSQTPNDADEDYDDEDDEEYDDEDEVGFGSDYDYISENGLDVISTPVAPTDSNGKPLMVTKNLFGSTSSFTSAAVDSSADKTQTTQRPSAFEFKNTFGGSASALGTNQSPAPNTGFGFNQPNTAPFSFSSGNKGTDPGSAFSFATGSTGSSTFSFLSSAAGANLFSQAAAKDAAVSLSAFGVSTTKATSPPRDSSVCVSSHPNLFTLLSSENTEAKPRESTTEVTTISPRQPSEPVSLNMASEKAAATTSAEVTSTSIAGPSTTSENTSVFSTPGIFGAKVTSPPSGLFGTTKSFVDTTTTSGTSTFGQPANAIVSAQPEYKSTPTSSATTLSTPHIQTTTSLFGKAALGTAPAISSSSLGSTAVVSSTGSIFGSAGFGTTTTQSFSGFSNTSNPGSIFGGSTFGTPTPTSTSVVTCETTVKETPTTAIFGSKPTLGTSATSSAVFGASVISTSGATSFSSLSTTSAATSSDISSATSASTSIPSLTTTSAATPFGMTSNAPTTTTSSTSLFSTINASTSSPFGTSTQSGFGNSMSQSAPPFGQSTTTNSSGFGSSNSQSTSGFGSSSTAFGQTSSFGQSTGTFGQGTSTFGQSTGSFGQSGIAFGQSSNTFGQSTGSFGQSAQSSTPGFGQQTSTSGSGTSAFSGTSSNSGGLFSGLGGQPSAEKANTNVFGGNQVFGTSTQQTGNLFGSGRSNGLGNATGVFGSGSTSNSNSTFTGSSGVASTGFGASAPTGQSGFGGAPAFGGSASFGSSAPGIGNRPTFGSSPAFGGSPGGSATTFGSPATFGSTSPSAAGAGFSGFNTAATSPTFGSLAQNTQVPTFGSIGQANSGFGSQPSFGSPSFGSQQQTAFGSTNNTSSFGTSSSFSSYR